MLHNYKRVHHRILRRAAVAIPNVANNRPTAAGEMINGSPRNTPSSCLPATKSFPGCGNSPPNTTSKAPTSPPSGTPKGRHRPRRPPPRSLHRTHPRSHDDRRTRPPQQKAKPPIRHQRHRPIVAYCFKNSSSGCMNLSKASMCGTCPSPSSSTSCDCFIFSCVSFPNKG
jgi:hypothetical protein